MFFRIRLRRGEFSDHYPTSWNTFPEFLPSRWGIYLFSGLYQGKKKSKTITRSCVSHICRYNLVFCNYRKRLSIISSIVYVGLSWTRVLACSENRTENCTFYLFLVTTVCCFLKDKYFSSRLYITLSSLSLSLYSRGKGVDQEMMEIQGRKDRRSEKPLHSYYMMQKYWYVQFSHRVKVSRGFAACCTIWTEYEKLCIDFRFYMKSHRTKNQ